MQRDRPNRLFSEVMMFAAMETQRRAALDEIARIDPNRLLNTPTEDLVDYIAKKYQLEVPVVDRQEAVLDEPRETTIPVYDFGRHIEVRATAYTLTVPFTGDPVMFKIQPTTFDSMPPAAEVRGSVLCINVVTRGEDGGAVNDKNIFIAECKFWNGEKALVETIDQILGYLSWRDTKAAIILFNRNKGFSEVLAKVQGAANGHPNRKRGPKIESETRFRYVFGNPSDMSREIILTIVAFDVPN
jgi:hypothetical protein